jgi:hypothetical protein
MKMDKYTPFYRLVFINKDSFLSQFKNVEIQGLYLDRTLTDAEAKRMYSLSSYTAICRLC